MNRTLYALFLPFLLLTLQAVAQPIVPISDADIAPGQTVNWTKDKIYLLNGLVFVENGSTLNIEAGTVVKFTELAEVGNPSALVIARGGKIFAEGTPEEPIIFTAEADDTNDPTDLGPTDVSLWGGLVILGNGVTQKNGNAEVSVEGIPTSEPRGLYGGNDNTDDSGVLKYVSIRHGGRQIVSGNELNGLTLAAVGSGTTLEYIEIYANSDDGIEFFGGAPNLKYAVVAFAEDDSYDWDEVYTGQGQFWFSIQRPDVADLGGELDGSTPDDLSPSSNPTVYNWTHIGAGPNAAAANPLGWLFRAGTAGTVANSIVVAQKGKAIEIQDKNSGTNDAHQKMLNGELRILNNLIWEAGANTSLDASASGVIRVTSGQATQDDPTGATITSNLVMNNNLIADPKITSISRTQDNGLDPRPSGNSAAYNTDLAALPAGDFFTEVNYKGAFSPFADELWIKGWTALDRNNHLADLSGGEIVNIDDSSIQPCENVVWTKDKTYLLNGLVFVEDCATLTIEAGTVVKFTELAEVGNPSALIIARGGKIFAEGTAEEPIIFTAEADDVSDPLDLGPTDVSLWGGLAILGNGITQKNGNANANLEGIPTTEVRGNYGGDDNTDNSGVLKYVSIRHGGRQIVSGNELNGLSLAAVGSGTTLEYIEIYANSDDGIEFFGGAPNLKYAVVAFAEDDSYDWDEVYTGQGQFWFSIQRADVADLGGELDGSTPDDLSPSSNPTVYNWTHIGAGPGAAASNPLGWLFRAGTAGTVANSMVVAQKGKAIEIQDKNTGTNDSHQKMLNGELKILNNLFWEAGGNTTLDAVPASGIIRVTSGQPTQDDMSGVTITNNLVMNANLLDNPGIQSISRIQDNNLDPRPSGSGAAVNTALAAVPSNDFFTQVSYKGAFSPFASDLWIQGWTALARNNHLKDLTQGGQIEFVTDADVEPCQNIVWTNDKTYVVDGVLFVEDCATLTIEAGTVVKFTERADVGNPSALVVARGGKIFAEGTVDQPIIFTAEADDVEDAFDLGPTDVSLWGGLALLGKGITQKNGNPTANLEGIPTTEPRGNYGGTDNTDNSGVLKYVTIRHGGRQIVSSSELNGLSLAAVGSGTTLEYIEVYANSDDGIEFFGGAPNLKYAVVAFAEDDSYDWDEVYTGKGQFWFSIQREDVADLGGELDGSTPDDLTPSSNPTVYNWTHIGSGPGAAASNPLGWLFRAGTAGTVANCIVASQKNKALEVQDKNTGTNDAHQKLVSGDLKILNNLFWECGTNTTIDATGTGIIRVTSGQPTQDDPTGSVLINHLNTNNNAIADPQILRISRQQDNMLDPRVLSTGAAYNTQLATYPAGDPFFTSVNYKGAFAESDDAFWLRGWTTLWTNQHIGLVNSTEQVDVTLNEVFNIFPNPASSAFTVVSKFNEPVNIEIFDLSGQLLRTLNSVADELTRVEIAALPAGMYVIKFTTQGGKFVTKKLIVD